MLLRDHNGISGLLADAVHSLHGTAELSDTVKAATFIWRVILLSGILQDEVFILSAILSFLFRVLALSFSVLPYQDGQDHPDRKRDDRCQHVSASLRREKERSVRTACAADPAFAEGRDHTDQSYQQNAGRAAEYLYIPAFPLFSNRPAPFQDFPQSLFIREAHGHHLFSIRPLL